MRKALISLVVGCSLSLALVPWAQAATTLHYSCTDGTSCTPGATTLVTGNTSPSFNITVQGLTGSTGGTDTLYIIALARHTAALSFSVTGDPIGLIGVTTSLAVLQSGTFGSGNGKLYSTLVPPTTGFFAATADSTANPAFSAYKSASEQAAGTVPATGFDVYVATFSLTGVPTNATGGGLTLFTGSITPSTITGDPLPVGTVLLAALSDLGGPLTASTTIVNNSTPLSEAVTTVVPEPSSLLLLGSAMAGLGVAGRKKFLNAIRRK